VNRPANGQSLFAEPVFSLPSMAVIRVLEAVAIERGGLPTILKFDNGPEFTSHAMLRWAAERDIELHFIDPGKPKQNGSVESFNARALTKPALPHPDRVRQQVNSRFQLGSSCGASPASFVKERPENKG